MNEAPYNVDFSMCNASASAGEHHWFQRIIESNFMKTIAELLMKGELDKIKKYLHHRDKPS